jgi:dipeptidyl aminopeptidase/acylaminoacyl peptidase
MLVAVVRSRRILRIPAAPMAGALGLLFCFLGGGTSAEASFPGLNGKIAYSSNQDDDTNTEIYTMNPDGSGQTRLTITPGSDDWPSWSPDGTRIAFVSQRDGNAEIYVMGADGSNPKRLTTDPESDFAPTWSPDGARIAFFTFRNSGTVAIYLMNADGSNQHYLTTGEDPDWSPDGTKLAFWDLDLSTPPAPPNAEVFVINADGSGRTNRSNSPGVTDLYPAWSPDGGSLVFVRSLLTSTDTNVWRMASNGFLQTQLTSVPPGAADLAPTWSPDGSKIAFWRYPPSSSYGDIWVMDADGNNEVNRTTTLAAEYAPSWQRLLPPVARLTASPDSVPTGQSVNFSAAGSNDPAGFITIYKWDLDGNGSFETDTGTSTAVSRSYPSAGSVNASVMAIDNDGLTSTASVGITVRNRAPRPFVAISPNPAETGKRVNFDGSASSDPDGTITSYRWDLDGNGSFETDTGTNPRTSRTYARSLNRAVTLRVTDNHGEASSTVAPFAVKSPSVNAGVQLFVGASGNGIKVRRFFLVRVPTGSRVELACKLKGKPACKRTRVARTRSSQVTFGRLRGKRIRARTLIEIKITKRGWIGKYIAINVKRGGYSRPKVRCIKPGSTKPVRSCR